MDRSVVWNDTMRIPMEEKETSGNCHKTEAMVC